MLDEPVSSQDISIRAQILNILKDLQDEYGLGCVFISHDLATVRFMAHDVVVMYLGRVIERGTAEAICTRPGHPYTKAMLAAALPPDPDAPEPELPPQGELPSPLDPPSGCPYHTRLSAQHGCLRGRAAPHAAGSPWWARRLPPSGAGAFAMSLDFVAVGDVGPDRDDPETIFDAVRDRIRAADLGFFASSK